MEKRTAYMKAAAGHILPVLRRYSAVWAVLLAGVLLLVSGNGCEQKPIEQSEIKAGFDLASFETQLSEKLAAIEGVGRVSLMLSLNETEESVYAVNVRQSTGSAQSYESNLAVLSDNNYGEAPVTVKNVLPSFRGAVVLCDGADEADVRLAVIHAVSTVCGIGSNKVTVLKMAADT